MKMNNVYITKSVDQTHRIAEELARSMKGGEVLLLYGNLGSGKTTFMQGFAKALGVTQRIISPTFIILRQYKGKKMLFHADLYRISTEGEIADLGLSDAMGEKDAIVAIEWSEKLGEALPTQRIELHFDTIGENERKIRIDYVG